MAAIALMAAIFVVTLSRVTVSPYLVITSGFTFVPISVLIRT